jgi:hypothetical protein
MVIGCVGAVEASDRRKGVAVAAGAISTEDMREVPAASVARDFE